MDNFGFLKVAAAVPHVRVADCDYNTERMAAMAEEAARRGVEIVAFPELGVTAYTCGDLLLQQTLLDAADGSGLLCTEAIWTRRWNAWCAPRANSPSR